MSSAAAVSPTLRPRRRPATTQGTTREGEWSPHWNLFTEAERFRGVGTLLLRRGWSVPRAPRAHVAKRYRASAASAPGVVGGAGSLRSSGTGDGDCGRGRREGVGRGVRGGDVLRGPGRVQRGSQPEPRAPGPRGAPEE